MLKKIQTTVTLPPAPWKAYEDSANSIEIRDANGSIVVSTCTEHDTGPKERAVAKAIVALPALIQAAQEFCAKVERGEARSVRTYAAFKKALA